MHRAQFALSVLSLAAGMLFSGLSFAQADRQPECLREQLAVQQVTAEIAATGQPVGILIIPAGLIGDPLYNNGEWSKYQAAHIERVRSGTNVIVRRYSITIHYMYNGVTGQVAQVKLKNSRTDGCDGRRVQATYVDMPDGDIFVERLPPPDIVATWDVIYARSVKRPSVEVIEYPPYEIPVLSGGGGCVHVDSLLPDGRRAGDVRVGDQMELGDENIFDESERKFSASSGVVTFSKRITAPGYRIVTSGGTSLICSDTAPIPTKGGLVHAPKLLGLYVPVKKSIEHGAFCGWEKVVAVDAVGLIDVQHITVGDRCFWAGETEDSFILHHNLKMVSYGEMESWWPDWWWW